MDFLSTALRLLNAPGNAVRTGIVHGPGSIMQGLTGDIETDATELPGINQLPDEGPELGPLHLTPRTVGGAVAGGFLDPLSYLGAPLLHGGASVLNAAGRKLGLGALEHGAEAGALDLGIHSLAPGEIHGLTSGASMPSGVQFGKGAMDDFFREPQGVSHPPLDRAIADSFGSELDRAISKTRPLPAGRPTLDEVGPLAPHAPVENRVTPNMQGLPADFLERKDALARGYSGSLEGPLMQDPEATVPYRRASTTDVGLTDTEAEAERRLSGDIENPGGMRATGFKATGQEGLSDLQRRLAAIDQWISKTGTSLKDAAGNETPGDMDHWLKGNFAAGGDQGEFTPDLILQARDELKQAIDQMGGDLSGQKRLLQNEEAALRTTPDDVDHAKDEIARFRTHNEYRDKEGTVYPPIKERTTTERGQSYRPVNPRASETDQTAQGRAYLERSPRDARQFERAAQGKATDLNSQMVRLRNDDSLRMPKGGAQADEFGDVAQVGDKPPSVFDPAYADRLGSGTVGASPNAALHAHADTLQGADSLAGEGRTSFRKELAALADGLRQQGVIDDPSQILDPDTAMRTLFTRNGAGLSPRGQAVLNAMGDSNTQRTFLGHLRDTHGRDLYIDSLVPRETNLDMPHTGAAGHTVDAQLERHISGDGIPALDAMPEGYRFPPAKERDVIDHLTATRRLGMENLSPRDLYERDGLGDNLRDLVDPGLSAKLATFRSAHVPPALSPEVQAAMEANKQIKMQMPSQAPHPSYQFMEKLQAMLGAGGGGSRDDLEMLTKLMDGYTPEELLRLARGGPAF